MAKSAATAVERALGPPVSRPVIIVGDGPLAVKEMWEGFVVDFQAHPDLCERAAPWFQLYDGARVAQAKQIRMLDHVRIFTINLEALREEFHIPELVGAETSLKWVQAATAVWGRAHARSDELTKDLSNARLVRDVKAKDLMYDLKSTPDLPVDKVEKWTTFLRDLSS